MHAHEKVGDSGADDRLAVRKVTTAAPEAPGGLRALHAGAGNAAVVQMLRQAGHPWAQDEHQHGAGCGHSENGQAPMPAVQRSAAQRPAVQRSAVHDVLGTAGRPLDEAVRTDMEARLGADFSDVRIHSDTAAKASAAEVGARAYTSGSHVVLGDGGTDRHTLAHELTHVIQQRTGPVAGTDNGNGLKVSDPSDRFEREAEANATRALAADPRPASYEQRQEGLAQPSEQSSAQRFSAQQSAEQPSVQRAYDQDNPENPQNLMSVEHWERRAGLRNSDGSSTKQQSQAAADLLTGKGQQAKPKGAKGAKGAKPKGRKRSMNEIIQTVGPALLQQLAQDSAKKSGRLELFRAMQAEEADNILAYWGTGTKSAAVEEYVSAGGGTSDEFKGTHEVMNLGSHLGDREQADSYHAQQGPAYSVLLKFTLKPGAHELLFHPDHMALGTSYAGKLIDRATGEDYEQAAGGEGMLPGYVGVKSEKRGPFSLSIAQDPKTKDASPSQLLFQLFVESVSEVSRKPV
ncbi:DUF4157 domain-containing protein [Streptomyces sp. NPDC021093]|uniref:DUF4157 domain-containing protein n=1 Tax=Streptomyces sp. NPDC021093 TaxID=3365112 RepID=UPI00378FC364